MKVNVEGDVEDNKIDSRNPLCNVAIAWRENLTGRVGDMTVHRTM